MGSTTKPERLQSARPILMSSTLRFYTLNLQKLYAKSRRLNLADWHNDQEYPEYIHSLWNTMLTHSAFKEEAKKIEQALGAGDAIQLLSDMVTEHRKSSNGE